MKKFLQLLLVFTFFLMLGFVCILFQAGTQTDEFYYRFATPKQQSLVLGTSRSAQGINPAVLDSVLNRNDIFNYSFTNDHSPYGKVYLESIRKKLDDNSIDGIFILSVDPWCLSSVAGAPEDPALFRENGLMLDKLFAVNVNPNVFYLMKFYDRPYMDLLTGEHDKELVLKENGWLEVNVPMDSASVKKRSESRMSDYREKVKPSYAPSNLRIAYLEETIHFLKKHGDVFLVRLPVSLEMALIEHEYYPFFDAHLNVLANKHAVNYFIMNDMEAYSFTDGNHLSKVSSSRVSMEIGRFISTHSVKKN